MGIPEKCDLRLDGSSLPAENRLSGIVELGRLVAYKRLKIARLILTTRLHKAWPGSASASLFVLNYHRIWPTRDGGPSRYDDGVFGPDIHTFRRQMEWLRATTCVLDEDGLIELAGQSAFPRGAIYSAVTFDDAYRDCYSIARPILDEFGIRAIFFVPIDMIESRVLGWWDQAAFLLKETRHDVIRVRGESLELRADFLAALRRVLRMFKLEPAEKTIGLLDELSYACGVSLPSKDLQSAELMSWDEILHMRRAGHAIGSHTLSHRVLATLGHEQQAIEIKQSRARLELNIGCRVRSFAYPVGGPQHFNSTSVELVKEAGYELAFSFNTGIETLPIVNRFRIRREAADSFDLLEAKVLMPSLMGIRQKQAV